jgi:hypothetical protein
MWILIYLLLAATAVGQDDLNQQEKIVFINSSTDTTPIDYTNIDAGPVVGNMLNAHYFPGLIAFNRGSYGEAHAQFSFVVQRAFALDANARQAEFMSTAYYLRRSGDYHHSTAP